MSNFVLEKIVEVELKNKSNVVEFAKIAHKIRSFITFIKKNFLNHIDNFH